MTRRLLILGGLVLALALPDLAIARKERLLASGTPMLLELAPVDPRSLMQGDYMRLDYALTRNLRLVDSWPRDGRIVVSLDSAGVAHFVRREETGMSLAPGERLLQYRRRGGRIRVGTDAFHFQEGLANRFAGARYGDLRVDDEGTSLLVGLRSAELVPLR
jgi:uncharacterized membrane-anchored protein